MLGCDDGAMTVKVCRQVFVDDVPLQGLLSVENDVSTAWTDLPEPDPRWSFVDARGHFHARDAAGELPTLVSKPEHVDCDGSCGGQCGGEGFTAVRWLCRICDEVVVPGTVPGPREVVVASRRSWSVFVEDAPAFGSELVSVRLECGGQPTMFGVARVDLVSRSSAGSNVKLWGEGPLSVMAAAPAGLVQS